MYRVAGPLLIEATIAVAKERGRKKTTGDEADVAVVQLFETDFECFFFFFFFKLIVSLVFF